MSQVPVKWCRTDLMTDHQLHYANGDPMGKQIPVVPLSALREVVEFVKAVSDKHYQTWKYHAEFADDPTDHDTLHADLMKHDPIYAKAQRLLASLGEKEA